MMDNYELETKDSFECRSILGKSPLRLAVQYYYLLSFWFRIISQANYKGL